MAIAVNPSDYLARLDTSGADTTPAATTPATTPTGTVAYYLPSDSKEQFYLVLFLALALVLIFLYLLERDNIRNRPHMLGE